MAMKINALFKKAAPAAPAKGTKSTKVAKPSSGSKNTRGWLGGEGGSQTPLDKWYGEFLLVAALLWALRGADGPTRAAGQPGAKSATEHRHPGSASAAMRDTGAAGPAA